MRSKQMRDPIGTMRSLYAHFEEPLTAEAEAAMQRLLSDNPKGKHGRHDYSLAEFGLSEETVRERYRDYCEQFGIGG